jgi:DNA-binding LacI/PurR family transcriptional regulator
MSAMSPKYFELAASLEKRLQRGHLKVGEKLPPIRTLASRHGVSNATMNRSIQLLVKKGFLDSRPGGGTVVQRLPRRDAEADQREKDGVIGFVLVHSMGMGQFDANLLAGIQSRLKTHRKRVEFEQFEDPFEPEAVARLAQLGWEGLIVTGAVCDHHVRALRAAKLPFVVTGNYDLHEPCDTIRFDAETSCRRMFEHLLRHGFRRIGVVVGRMDYYGNRAVVEACADAHRAMNIPFDQGQIEADEENAGEGSLDRLIERMGKPDAIVSTGFALRAVVRRLHAHGLEARRNVALAGMWNSGAPQLVRLNIRLEMSEVAWHEATVDTLLERLRRGHDEQPVHVSVPVTQTIDGNLPNPEDCAAELTAAAG